MDFLLKWKKTEIVISGFADWKNTLNMRAKGSLCCNFKDVRIDNSFVTAMKKTGSCFLNIFFIFFIFLHFFFFYPSSFISNSYLYAFIFIFSSKILHIYMYVCTCVRVYTPRHVIFFSIRILTAERDGSLWCNYIRGAARSSLLLPPDVPSNKQKAQINSLK